MYEKIKTIRGKFYLAKVIFHGKVKTLRGRRFPTASQAVEFSKLCQARIENMN